MSNNSLPNEEKKPSLLWSMTKSTLAFIFPSIRMYQINRQLARISKFYKHEYFGKQRLKNSLVGLLSSSPFLISTALSVLIVYKDKDLSKNFGYFYEYLLRFELTRSFNYLSKVISDPSGALHAAGTLWIIGLVVSFILGFIISKVHPMISDSAKLYDMLKRNGVIDRDEKHRLVLATPLGFLIDITGSSAREVKDNDRIWRALNQRVVDWSEDPSERAVVFFKKAYELRDTYVYKYEGK